MGDIHVPAAVKQPIVNDPKLDSPHGVFDYVTGVSLPTGYAAGTYRDMTPVNHPTPSQHIVEGSYFEGQGPESFAGGALMVHRESDQERNRNEK